MDWLQVFILLLLHSPLKLHTKLSFFEFVVKCKTCVHLSNCAGMGYSMTFLPTVTILSQYFNHRRSLVTAVASTGESLSMFALAPGGTFNPHALKDECE